jgi:hypothetical protein
MDIKRRLPPKVYDEVVLRIAHNQDQALVKQKNEEKAETPESLEKMEKVSSRKVILITL